MQPLTEFENGILATLVKKRGWVEVPRNEAVDTAMRHLAAHKMVVRKHEAWWMVRATAKAKEHVAARTRGRAYRMQRC